MRPTRIWLWLSGALILASCLKVYILVAGVLPFNSDEAIVALMGRHITRGELPVFFYGQSYMGSLDGFLVAIGFLIFGEHVWVIRMVQAILYLITVGTTAVLGKMACDSWKVGLTAAWLLAIPIINVTLYTTASLGGYGEMLLIGNLILWVVLRIAAILRRGETANLHLLWLTWGFLVGLGLWAFGLTLVYSLPSTIYLAWIWLKNRKETAVRVGLTGLKKEFSWLADTQFAFLALVGGVIGAAPWVDYAFRFGFKDLINELQGSAIAGVEGLSWLGQVFQHLVNLLLLGVTVIFGFRPPWEVHLLGVPLLPLVLAIWLGVLAFIFQHFRNINTRNSSGLMIAGVGATLLVGFIFTPFGADPSGRYFVPLAIPLAIFTARTVVSLSWRWGRMAYSLIAIILVYNLWGTLQSAMKNPPGITTQFDAVTQIDHRYDRELVQFLSENEETRGYTNYWVAYPLAFKSKEELIFVPRLPYHEDLRYTERDDRYMPYDQVVAEAQRVAYITTNHLALDAKLREKFRAIGVSWAETQIGDYHVFYDLSQVVRPKEIGLGMTTP